MKSKKYSEQNTLVSIIIPCCNYGHLIQETLDSLQSQEFQNWEAIVIDDGSSDDSEAKVSAYQEQDLRIHYIYQENEGVSAARNLGIQIAKGKYIQFLDADDLLSERKLQIQFEFMELNRDCLISYTGASYFLSEQPFELFKNFNRSNIDWMPKVSGTAYELLPHFIKTNIFPVTSPLIRRSFMVENALLFDCRYRYIEDWSFWLTCLFAGANFIYLENKQCEVFIRIHGESLTNQIDKMSFYEIKLRKELRDRLMKSYFEPNKNELLRSNRRQLRDAGRKFINKENRINARNMKQLIQEIGLFDASIALVKELNFIRKNKVR